MTKFKMSAHLFMVTVLAASSLSFSNTARSTPSVVGANQIMEETRVLLFKNAYRIDKELIGYTDSENKLVYNLDRTTTHVAEKKVNPLVSVAGGILGGLLGGAGGIALKLGSAGFGLGMAGGAVLGGAIGTGHGYEDKSKDNLSIEVNNVNSTRSQNYQIHDRSNTWGILVVDTSSYKKALPAILQSEVMKASTCARQGMAFIDGIIGNFRFFSSEDFETLAANLIQLQAIRLRAAIEADKTSSISPLADKINQFLDQRIRVIRINWQDYVAATGTCQDNLNSSDAVNKAANELFGKVKESSVLLSSNSMEHIPNITFANLPYKKTTEGNVSNLEASQARLMLTQAITLQKLKELGYIEFTRKSSIGGMDLRNISIEAPYRILTKKMPQEFYLRDDFKNWSIYRFSADGNLAKVMALNSAITLAGTFFFSAVTGSTLDKGFTHPVISSSAASVVIGLGTYIGNRSFNQLENKNQELRAEIASRIRHDRSVNNAINAHISTVEILFNLGTSEKYNKARIELVEEFKGLCAMDLLNQIAAGNPQNNLRINNDFGRFLGGKGIISDSQLAEVEMILNFLTGNQIVLKNVDKVRFQENQVQSLLMITRAIEKEVQDPTQRADLSQIAARLSRELDVIKLLK